MPLIYYTFRSIPNIFQYLFSLSKYIHIIDTLHSDYVNSTKKEEDNLYEWVEPFSMLPMSGLGLAVFACIAIVAAVIFIIIAVHCS
jgi:hypothetical protein